MGEGVEEVVGGGLGPVGVDLAGGGGGGSSQALAGRADGQRRGRQLHVERRRRGRGGGRRPGVLAGVVGRRRRRGELDGAELLQLPLQPAVLLGERLAAALQELAVHLRLLQLRPACTCNTGSNVSYTKSSPPELKQPVILGRGFR